MKKLNKKIVSMILAATMLGSALTGCSKTNKVDGTQIAATVDDYEVTLGMAHLILRENQAASEDYMEYLAQLYGMNADSLSMWDDKAEDGKTYGEQQKEQVMGTISELYAFKNHAKDYDIELTEKDHENIKAAAKQFMEDNTQKAIDALGVSESDIVTYLELITIRSRMYEPMIKDVDRNVSAEESNQTTLTLVTISTAGTEKDKDGKVIALTEKQLAEKEALGDKIIAAIQKENNIAKADIKKIAEGVDKNVTVETSSFTTFNKDQYAIDQAVVDAVLTMKDGELNGKVIKGKSAYYVVRLDAMLDKEATENKKEEIIEKRESDAHAELAKKWTYETKVSVKYDVWSQVKLTDQQSFRYVEEEEDSDKK